MRVTVRQQGGVAGIDQLAEVDGAVARLVDGGKVAAERELGGPVQGELEQLAGACAEAMDAAPGDSGMSATPVADSMETTVMIEHEGFERAIRFWSTDDVPAEVHRLVSAVVEAPHRDPGSRWKRKS